VFCMILQRTVIIPLNSINQMVFIMEIQFVFCEVRTEILNMVNSTFSVSLGSSGFGH
jgi:hypothetical protein